MIEEGAPLPAVTVTLADGSARSLRSYVGRNLVIYFYPKDDTSGCTREAQDFSAFYPEFQAAGAELLGISPDTVEKHGKFAAKYGLTVPLASDPERVAIEAFGLWGEKKLYGRSYMGVERATFLFDAHGLLVRQWRRVKVPGHAAAVLAALPEIA